MTVKTLNYNNFTLKYIYKQVYIYQRSSNRNIVNDLANRNIVNDLANGKYTHSEQKHFTLHLAFKIFHVSVTADSIGI